MPDQDTIEVFDQDGDDPIQVGQSEVLDSKIQKLMEFFDLHGIDYKKFKPESRDFLGLTKKRAYPNYDQYMYTPGAHDTQKWLMSVKDIYYKQKAGFPYKEAVRSATQGWKKMEILDFLNWMRFYEEGAHMKWHKTAQVWYDNGQPGYFLPLKQQNEPVKEPEPTEPEVDMDAVREEAERSAEKRRLIEKQRAKIIGRLDSAEKLLRTDHGQMFADKELEGLMEAIYTLKKKVQLVNKLSVSTRLYEDMIVREANILGRQGFMKASETLYALSQTPGAVGQQATGKQSGGKAPPDAQSPGNPTGAGHPGAPGGLPAQIPGVPDANTPVGQEQNDNPSVNSLLTAPPPQEGTVAVGPALIPQEEPQPKGISEFIENMNSGNQTDDLEVSDADDTLEVNDQELVVEAQMSPKEIAQQDIPITTSPAPAPLNPVDPLPPIADKPKPPVEKSSSDIEVNDPEPPLEVHEDDLPDNGLQDMDSEDKNRLSDFDAKLKAVYSEATIGDVVAKLEMLSKFYKVRAMPRELSQVDSMLDSLGLASFFPGLAEAQNKSIDAYNYISTRVDDMLAKLRGAMGSVAEPANAPENPETAGLRNKLQEDEDKEKRRKQQRKEKDVVEEAKETPKVEMNDLAVPIAPPTPPAPKSVV